MEAYPCHLRSRMVYRRISELVSILVRCLFCAQWRHMVPIPSQPWIEMQEVLKGRCRWRLHSLGFNYKFWFCCMSFSRRTHYCDGGTCNKTRGRNNDTTLNKICSFHYHWRWALLGQHLLLNNLGLIYFHLICVLGLFPCFCSCNPFCIHHFLELWKFMVSAAPFHRHDWSVGSLLVLIMNRRDYRGIGGSFSFQLYFWDWVKLASNLRLFVRLVLKNWYDPKEKSFPPIKLSMWK